MSNPEERLREEINRLGISALARALGVARNTLYNWAEKGNVPMDRFAALVSAGVDLVYVLAGERNYLDSDGLEQLAMTGIQAGALAAAKANKNATGQRHPAAPPALSPEQRALLDNYAACGPEDRAAVRRFAAAAAQSLSAPVRKGTKR